MKRIFALTGILALFLLVGCGQKEAGHDDQAADDHGAAGHTHDGDDGHGHDHDGDAGHDHDATTAGTAGEVTLAGVLGCGHCTYQLGDGCSAAMKTADGTVYILDGVDNQSEAYQKRMEGGDVTVVGVVAEGDPPHVKVTSIDL